MTTIWGDTLTWYWIHSGEDNYPKNNPSNYAYHDDTCRNKYKRSYTCVYKENSYQSLYFKVPVPQVFTS